MDPLHPIIPDPPHIPPITPAPGVRRISRDANRAPGQGQGGPARDQEPDEELWDDDSDDDDSHPHIDVTV